MADDGDDVFSFLSLRPIRRFDNRTSPSAAIRDDTFEGATITNGGGIVGGQRLDVELYSNTSPSAVGKTVFRSVRRAEPLNKTAQAVEAVLSRVITTASGDRLAPIVTKLRLTAQDAGRLSAMAGRPQIGLPDGIIIFPGSVDDIAVPLVPSLSRLRADLQPIVAALITRQTADPAGPDRHMHALNFAPQLPAFVDLVFSRSGGGYAPDFQTTKRILFDAVYGLTVLRKVYPADPTPAISGLQTLHVMERLAVTFLSLHLAKLRNTPDFDEFALLAATLANGWPNLSFGSEDPDATQKRLKAAAMPFAWEPGGAAQAFDAQPVIPPIFARLGGAFQPFNSLRPVGIGDLMVVRQTFLGYRKGEIARVETVMAGEEKDRTIRRLDRTEDSQTFTFSEDSETTSETTTTERFELKREAEAVLRMDVNVGLNASVTYDQKPVVSTVAANFSLAVGKSESERRAESFARDVTERALSRVQRRASQSRSRTVIAETEDTSVHRLKAASGQPHVNGFYRWIDKVYQAEVRNYGRRLMFEVVVPEPAAFYVQSRLLAHIATLDLPDYPKKPDPGTRNDGRTPILGVDNAGKVSEAKWAELNTLYYLDHLPPPPATIEGVQIVKQNGTRNFTKATPYYSWGDSTDRFWDCSVLNPPAGYRPVRIQVNGSAKFAGKFETNPNWQNEFSVLLDGGTVFSRTEENLVNVDYGGEKQTPPSPFTVNDKFRLEFVTKTCEQFNVTLTLDYDREAATLAAWQTAVFEALTPERLRKKVNDVIGPDPDVEAYLKTLRDTDKATVREIIQGGSGAANRRRVEQEIRRLAISQFTNEFDAQDSDDQIGNSETMAELPVREGYRYPKLTITPGTADSIETQVSFAPPKRKLTGYQVPDVGLSRRKGVHIQFIEHAFEWTNLSYVFYPYYWATPPKWVELLDREDDADPFFTDFLQAGAARVLIAVRPGFEDAVMHYLATREPWNGGSVPVIGDDLHLPVHEEIRELTEDRAGTGQLVGQPWTVTLPTSLIFLDNAGQPLPEEWPP